MNFFRRCNEKESEDIPVNVLTTFGITIFGALKNIDHPSQKVFPGYDILAQNLKIP